MYSHSAGAKRTLLRPPLSEWGPMDKFDICAQSHNGAYSKQTLQIAALKFPNMSFSDDKIVNFDNKSPSRLHIIRLHLPPGYLILVFK